MWPGKLFLFGLVAYAPNTLADDNIAECSSVPIDLEIYVDVVAEDIVNMKYKTGDY